MTGNIALDVVLGLVFIYALYSLYTTVIVEMITSAFKIRALILQLALMRMLDDSSEKEVYLKEFYDQPIIKYLSSGKSLIPCFNKPSYIQPHNFSKALVEVFKKESGITGSITEKVQEGISRKKDTEIGGFILSLFEDSNKDLVKFKAYLEEWFNDTMERATGWFKRRLAAVTFLVGLGISLGFNVNTLEIVKRLNTDDKLSAQFVDEANILIKPKYLNIENDASQERYKEVIDKVGEVNSVVNIPRPKYYSFYDFLGVLITAIALYLGATFWFDILNKLMLLRGSSKTNTTNEEQKGKSTCSATVVPAKNRLA